MGGAELTVLQADLAPLRDVLPVGRELDDPGRLAGFAPGRHSLVVRHSLTVVAVGDEDAAVRSRDHVVGLIEVVRPVTRLPGRTQAHEQLAVRAELVDLMTVRAFLVPGEVGDPHVALGVDVDPVRSHEDAGAEVREDLSRVAVELEDRIDRVGVAVDAATAQGAGAAALVRPYVAVGRVDVDTRGGAPLATLW